MLAESLEGQTVGLSESLVQDVERHVQDNGPWRYNLSQMYQDPEVTIAVEQITLEEQAKIAA